MRDKGLFCQSRTNDPPTPSRLNDGSVAVAIDYAELKAGNREAAQALADARSARHLTNRRKREEASAERADEGARRRRKAMSDREAEAFLSRRLHIKMPEGVCSRRQTVHFNLFRSVAGPRPATAQVTRREGILA